jgi:uncharacterized protein (TIGR00255 family)
MTGYGRASVEIGNGTLAAEAKSVNSRYLDLSFRLPPRWDSLELPLGRLVRSYVSRGKVIISVFWIGRSSPLMVHEINAPLIRSYLRDLRVSNPGNWRSVQHAELLGAPGVVGASSSSSADLSETAVAVVETALRNLVDSRANEGKELKSELLVLSAKLGASVSGVLELSSQAEAALGERLEESLKKLGEHGNGVAGDKERLGREVAALLVKGDIDEELARLKSHIGAFERRLEDDGPHGKALEFLLQEMQRELNTLASKTPLLEVVQLALHGKGLVDRLREQVANVE